MNFLSGYKKDIIIALISSVIFEILKIFLTKTPSISSGILASFIDFPYNCAASADASYMVLSMLFSLFFALPVVFILFLVIYKKLHPHTDHSSQSSKSSFIRFIISSLSYLIISTILMWYIFLFPIQIHSTFDLSLDLIRPYTDQHTIDLLKSKWVSMERKSDYVFINSAILSICEENDLSIRKYIY